VDFKNRVIIELSRSEEVPQAWQRAAGAHLLILPVPIVETHRPCLLQLLTMMSCFGVSCLLSPQSHPKAFCTLIITPSTLFSFGLTSK